MISTVILMHFIFKLKRLGKKMGQLECQGRFSKAVDHRVQGLLGKEKRNESTKYTGDKMLEDCVQKQLFQIPTEGRK